MRNLTPVATAISLAAALTVPNTSNAATLDLASRGLVVTSTIASGFADVDGDFDFYFAFGASGSGADFVIDGFDPFDATSFAFSLSTLGGDTLSGFGIAAASDATMTEILFDVDRALGIFAAFDGRVLARLATPFALGDAGSAVDVAFTVENVAPVPLPASGILLMLAIGGTVALRNRRVTAMHPEPTSGTSA